MSMLSNMFNFSFNRSHNFFKRNASKYLLIRRLMNMLKDFFKQRDTWLGIFAALAFQIIFSVVWLTGYDGVYERFDQFSIGIVNEDKIVEQPLLTHLMNDGTFNIVPYELLEEAKEELNERAIQMVMHIKDDVTIRASSGDNVNVDYYINQSVPSITKQVMENGANEMNKGMNDFVNREF